MSIIGYHSELFQPNKRKMIVAFSLAASRAIAKRFGWPTTIASCGISGNMVAFNVAEAMKLPSTIIRKQDEHSHGRTVEGYTGPGTAIIIDDFPETGRTVARMVAILSTFGISTIGIVFWSTVHPIWKARGLFGPYPDIDFNVTIPMLRRYHPDKRYEVTQHHLGFESGIDIPESWRNLP